MADTQAKTYTVTFNGSQTGRPKYTHHTDETSNTRFPVGVPVRDVSQAAVKRLQALSTLQFKVTEQTPKES